MEKFSTHIEYQLKKKYSIQKLIDFTPLYFHSVNLDDYVLHLMKLTINLSENINIIQDQYVILLPCYGYYAVQRDFSVGRQTGQMNVFFNSHICIIFIYLFF